MAGKRVVVGLFRKKGHGNAAQWGVKVPGWYKLIYFVKGGVQA